MPGCCVCPHVGPLFGIQIVPLSYFFRVHIHIPPFFYVSDETQDFVFPFFFLFSRLSHKTNLPVSPETMQLASIRRF